ncbi:RPM1-interacting protein 4 [Glycine soja]|nr:RPM1-interacting protein 4 [Glycine soja]
MASYEQDGKPLPKFGEWDVNDPASAEGFTVIFNKARDEKKTGRGGSGRATSQRRNNSCKDDDRPCKTLDRDIRMCFSLAAWDVCHDCRQFSSEASSVSRPPIRDKEEKKENSCRA